jgi:hypothetical protein
VGADPDCAHAPRHSVVESAITSLGRKIPTARKPRPPQFRQDYPLTTQTLHYDYYAAVLRRLCLKCVIASTNSLTP